MPAVPYNIRTYCEGDEHGLNDLFNQVFQRSRTLDEWKWKYLEVPVGFDPSLVVLAQDGDRVVGQFSASRWLLKVGDTKVIAAHTFDHSVIEEYRTRGVFIDLYQESLIHHREAVKLTYGFPNPVNFRIGTRLFGYTGAGQVPKLVRNLSLRPTVARRIQRPRLLEAVHQGSRPFFHLRHTIGSCARRVCSIRRVQRFDRRVDSLWEVVSPSFKVAVIRDSAYLTWRYRHPGQEYEIYLAEAGEDLLGYAVFRKATYGMFSLGLIAELMVGDDLIVAQSLLDRLVDRSLELGVDQMECWMVERYPLYQFLIRNGFFRAPSEVVLTYRILDDEIPASLVGDVNNWYLTLGDVDDL